MYTGKWKHNRAVTEGVVHTNIWKINYVGFVLICVFLSSRVLLSSVKSNEQMLLSCWSQHDGRSCWQAHTSAVWKWKGSSGHRTACRGALTHLCFWLFPPLLLHSSLTFRSLLRPNPTHSTLPPTVLSIWAHVGYSVRLITYLLCALVNSWIDPHVKRLNYSWRGQQDFWAAMKEKNGQKKQ